MNGELAANLAQLAEMTRRLPDMVRTEKNGCIEYEVESGHCLGILLFESPHVSVQRSLVTAGSIFPQHSHPGSVEHLVVYEGRVVVHYPDGVTLELEPGGAAVIPPNTPHSVVALEDSWLVGITIPPGEGYPHEPAE